MTAPACLKFLDPRPHCKTRERLAHTPRLPPICHTRIHSPMDSRKRKLSQGGLLGRRVRARAEPEPQLDDFEDDASSGAPSEQAAEEKEELQSGSDSGATSDDSSDQGPVSRLCPIHSTAVDSSHPLTDTESSGSRQRLVR